MAYAYLIIQDSQYVENDLLKNTTLSVKGWSDSFGKK